MTVEDRFKLHDRIVREILFCPRKEAYTSWFKPEYPSALIPDLPERMREAGHPGTLFGTRALDPDLKEEPLFVRLRLEPDGSLSETPKIIEGQYESQTFIEREPRSHWERLQIETIERCTPFRAVAAFADSYADWKTTCIFIPVMGSSADIYHIRGWHPCREELPLGELLRGWFHNR